MAEKRYKWRRDDYREKTKGLLMLNTGDGKGKTTAAIGVMVRAAGRELNCSMIQFMKAKGDRYQQWLTNVQQDIYISETENIITDTGNYN